MSRSMFNRGVAVEIEIAFVLGKSVRGPNIPAVDVMRATDFVLPAIEIVDRRYSRRGPGPLIVDSVADGAWCGGVVLGSNSMQLNQIDVRNIAGTLVIDGETRAHGFSSAVMGNPVLAVVWLANKLADFGVAVDTSTTYHVGGQIKDEDGFVGDKASRGAFHEMLEKWREPLRKLGDDPLGEKSSEQMSKKQLDKLLTEGDPEAGGIIHSAVEEFAQALVSVIKRFLKVASWRDTVVSFTSITSLTRSAQEATFTLRPFTLTWPWQTICRAAARVLAKPRWKTPATCSTGAPRTV